MTWQLRSMLKCLDFSKKKALAVRFLQRDRAQPASSAEGFLVLRWGYQPREACVRCATAPCHICVPCKLGVPGGGHGPGLGEARPGEARPVLPREPISVKRSSLSEYRNAGDIFNRELSRSSRPSPLH